MMSTESELCNVIHLGGKPFPTDTTTLRLFGINLKFD